MRYYNEVVIGGHLIIEARNFPGQFKLDATSALAKRVIKTGEFEPELTASLSHFSSVRGDVINIGANIGFISGVLIAGGLFLFEPFGPNIPNVAFFFMVVAATGFGAWVGGLTGIDSENQKLRRFHTAIEEGKYLILIYARKGVGEKIKDMMQERHPEARHVATDRHFINPFGRVRRKTQADRPQEQ